MKYYFAYSKAGVINCIKQWLEDECPETPEELANIIWKYSMH